MQLMKAPQLAEDSHLPLAAVLLVAVGVLARLLPHPANFTPIAAIGLFGGSYLPKRWALVLPLVAMIISDAFIGFYGLGTMLAVYGSFALVGLIGLWVKQHRSAGMILTASLVSSLLFFLITNAAVWLDPLSGYAPGLHGLLASYTAGLPFFRGTALGDLSYTTAFFGGYELVRLLGQRYLPTRLVQAVF